VIPHSRLSSAHKSSAVATSHPSARCFVQRYSTDQAPSAVRYAPALLLSESDCTEASRDANVWRIVVVSRCLGPDQTAVLLRNRVRLFARTGGGSGCNIARGYADVCWIDY